MAPTAQMHCMCVRAIHLISPSSRPHLPSWLPCQSKVSYVWVHTPIQKDNCGLDVSMDIFLRAALVQTCKAMCYPSCYSQPFLSLEGPQGPLRITFKSVVNTRISMDGLYVMHMRVDTAIHKKLQTNFQYISHFVDHIGSIFMSFCKEDTAYLPSCGCGQRIDVPSQSQALHMPS